MVWCIGREAETVFRPVVPMVGDAAPTATKRRRPLPTTA